MSHIYDEHETMAVLRRVVEAQGGGYRYPLRSGKTCLYWDREADAPLCLVGHVLARLGYPAPPLVVEGNSVSTAFGRDINPESDDYPQVVNYFTERFTLGALRVLDAAQVKQDVGATWAEALEEAEREYRNLHATAVTGRE